jgi:hypothetical protein
MRRSGGDAQNGFEVLTDPDKRLVRARVWGFWELPLATRCRSAMLDAFVEMGMTQPWCVLSDSRHFPPQKPEVQALIGEILFKGPSMGMRRTAFLVDSGTSKLQMSRLAAETNLKGMGFFLAEEEALRWLQDPL